jgi:hypothetical protein
MLRTLHRRAAFMVAAAGSALALGTGTAFAATGWTVVTAPPTGQNATLTGVATVSDSDAWAVGFRNGNAFTNVGAKVLIDTWNGTAWTQVATPATPQNTALLDAVNASSAADAWAVGRTQNNRSSLQGLALQWNGTAWSVSPSFAGALGAYALGVADISPADAYAVGNNSSIPRGHLAHWNGTAWSSVTVPLPPNAPTNTTLNAISADGPNDVWAVGTFLNSATGQFDNFTIHFNGTAWAVVPMPVSGSFDAIEANSPTDVWAVGDQGPAGSANPVTAIAHFNGTAWSAVPSPSPGQRANLTGVTTSNAANNVWAVGSFTPAGATSPQTLTLNWNGTAWSVVASPNPASFDGLNAVATNPGAAIVWAVGESGPAGSFNPLILQNG